jgi:hypothetical protein
VRRRRRAAGLLWVVVLSGLLWLVAAWICVSVGWPLLLGAAVVGAGVWLVWQVTVVWMRP